MRYVFFGTTEFSITMLRCLAENGYRPELVIANPDRPSGRKKILTSPPTKVLAEQEDIPVFQPESFDADAVARLKQIGADFFLLADYGKILPPAILQLSRLGVIGVHVSLLPQYRGPSPMQSAILNGDTETGVTLYTLDEGIDTGPILVQEKFALYRQTFVELRKEGALRACRMLKNMLPKFLERKAELRSQNHSQATYTKKFTSENAFVDSKDLEEAESGAHPEKAETIDRKIRALNPEPGVWTHQKGKRVKLLEADLAGGKLVLKKIQVEGQKPREL